MKKYKGHVKVTIRDAKTGHIDQVVEGDNIVTDAIQDLLSRNVLGCVDYTKIYPLWSRWYKGCLAFEEPFPEVNSAPDPTKYFIPDDSVNHVVAHAGDVSPDDIADDLKRGNPNTWVQVLTNNSVKMIWEWGPQQGCTGVDKYISSIALTHKDIGNCGTGADSDAFRSLQPFDVINIGLSDFTCNMNSEENVIGQYNGNLGWWFTIGEPGDYSAQHSKFRTQKITLYLKRLCFDEIGLYDTPNASNEFNIHAVVDLNDNIYCQPCYFVDGNKLHLFTNVYDLDQNGNLVWNNSVKHWTITWSDPSSAPTYTFETISTGRSDLAPMGWDSYAMPFFQSIGHGKYNNVDYWFFPCCSNSSYTTGATGFIRCGGSNRKYIPLIETQQYYRSAMTGNELCPVVMSGRVLNGDHGYTCQDQFTVNQNYLRALAWPASTSNAISSYVMPIGNGSTATLGRYIVANKFVTTTRFNLPSPVTKSASQSMTIEYTLTEV